MRSCLLAADVIRGKLTQSLVAEHLAVLQLLLQLDCRQGQCLSRWLSFPFLPLQGESGLDLPNLVGSIGAGERFIQQGHQDASDLIEPREELRLLGLQLPDVRGELTLQLQVSRIILFHAGSHLQLEGVVFLMFCAEGGLCLFNPALKLSHVLLYLLQLLLLSHELLCDEGEVFPALVLTHHLEHRLQVLSEPPVSLTDAQFLTVLLNLPLDAFLGEGNCPTHHFLRLFAEADAAVAQGLAEVVDRHCFGVSELLPQEGFLTDCELPTLVLLLRAGTVDMGVRLSELSRVSQVFLTELHDLLFQSFIARLQLKVRSVDCCILCGKCFSIALKTTDGVLVLGDLLAMEVDGGFELLDAVVGGEVVFVDVVDGVAGLPRPGGEGASLWLLGLQVVQLLPPALQCLPKVCLLALAGEEASLFQLYLHERIVNLLLEGLRHGVGLEGSSRTIHPIKLSIMKQQAAMQHPMGLNTSTQKSQEHVIQLALQLVLVVIMLRIEQGVKVFPHLFASFSLPTGLSHCVAGLIFLPCAFIRRILALVEAAVALVLRHPFVDELAVGIGGGGVMQQFWLVPPYRAHQVQS